MTTPNGLVDAALAPLDAVRRSLFLTVARWPLLGPLLTRRDSRVGLQAACGVVLLFVLTTRAPGLLYVLGPALLGVAHVASDARYLVLRRSLTRPFLAVLGVGLLALFGSRLVEGLDPTRFGYARFEVGVGLTLPIVAACFGAATKTSRSVWRLMVLLPLLTWVAFEAMVRPGPARAIFAHAHNVIALGLWVVLFRRRALSALPAVLLLVLGSALLFTGAAVAPFSSPSAWDRRFLEEMTMTGVGLPFLSAKWLVGVALCFVFLQSAHYSAWLWWIPQEDSRTEGTTSFRMSVKSMLHDFRAGGLVAIVALMMLVVLASAIDVHRTRHIYLSLATFHGYLELALFAYFVARGGIFAPDDTPAPRVVHQTNLRYVSASAWLTLFAITVVIEVPIVVLLVGKAEASWTRRIIIALAGQLATHPLVFFVFPQLPLRGFPSLVCSELYALGFEALLYGAAFVRLRPLEAFAIAGLANGVSFGLGLLLAP